MCIPPSPLHPPSIYTIADTIAHVLRSTKGTFDPKQDDHSAVVPTLPFTSLLPGKTAQGLPLPSTAEYKVEAIITNSKGEIISKGKGEQGEKVVITIK